MDNYKEKIRKLLDVVNDRDLIILIYELLIRAEV